MNFYARARASLLSWAHETPLPTADSKWYPKFQSWHHFHQSLQQWVAISDNDTRDHTEPPRDNDKPSDLALLTWNIDATSARTEDRITDITTFVTQLDPGVHIVFLQEVSKAALQQILKDERIRGSWISSEQDDTAWGKQSFATITLLSKARFASTALGPVWRVAYPSHFDRDALCCDIFVSCGRERSPMRISIISSFLRSAGCGLVAGDFNPVLEEDAALLESNGLTDVWTVLHPEDPGYTWGTAGEQPFPPNRMDKIATVGLKPHDIKTLEPQRLSILGGAQNAPMDHRKSQISPMEDTPPWSYHAALLCSFGLVGE
ncbi:hypothetical protein AARAC_008610 [Aspergillus arachidicola]|uniref:Endonuclease/exonuclease/phosphatase domain-containing protein n=1 Tax=Aspergillus arachidicola TaxID=656916 RepID=A0A2G7GAL5_9EURO|nr:hypothetical protein AARAC_008610 [Aspergillus arachidicola]